MSEYLIFRLYGPMASWGAEAVGGDRHTGMAPTRSAVLGLLGAALGIKRDDETQLGLLQASVRIAVKQTVPSTLMRDYHTTQVPTRARGVSHYTRKSELSENELNTILSSRDYRCDGLWIVAIRLSADVTFTLAQLKNALLRPKYVLSLGRKSCPLSLPLAPKVMSADSLFKALDTLFPSVTRSKKEDDFLFGSNGRATYYWEGEKGDSSDKAILTTHVWDEPLSRARWQFKQREMHQLSVEEGNHVSL